VTRLLGWASAAGIGSALVIMVALPAAGPGRAVVSLPGQQAGPPWWLPLHVPAALAAGSVWYAVLAGGAGVAAGLAAVARAREQGLRWAVVAENGDESRLPYVPYQRVEADVGSGRAVIVSAGPDETLARAAYRLEAGELDLATGQLRIGDEIGSYSDPAAAARELGRQRGQE
jgi:hypothetical protein